jgi:saccharopine dehydrogenase-like NADP-dependent oxidoreductase
MSTHKRKAFCLGGAGRICREAVLDLVQFSQFDRITVGDIDEQEGRHVGAQLLAAGSVSKTGVLIPEEAFDPETIFAELEKRDIHIHERMTEPAREAKAPPAGKYA